MKKSKKILLIISPIIIGMVFNYLILVPGLISILIYGGPIFFIIYWVWVAGLFQGHMKSPIKATLLANSGGIISLLIYIWQLILVSDDKRSLFLAGLSQDFSAPLSFLTVKIGMQFEKNPIEGTMITIFASQVAGLVIMMIVFYLGYSIKKRNEQSNMIDMI